MNRPIDNIIYKFIQVPIPIGTAGAFIWAVATFVQKWDPRAYPDLKSVFALPLMQIYSGGVILILLAFYAYIGIEGFRLTVLRAQVRLAERIYLPPTGMVLVPAGSFRFGLRGESVSINGFFISRYPVTNEQYLEFVQETKHSPPSSWENGCYPSHKVKHPVTCVDWEDAREYCKWCSHKTNLEFALPTEQEWEKAARGPFGYLYPWGNEFDLERCNVRVRKGAVGDTNQVGAYPKGVSPYGCRDMCGNVWEWTETLYNPSDPKDDNAVLKGSSYYFDEGFASLWIRYNDPKTDKWFDLGFRCVVRF